ncbi:MAG: DUF4837 family protein [Fidelibacterota bacterium]
MQFKVIIISLLIFLGCSTKKSAVGNSNSVNIFCSSEDRVFLEPVFAEFFSETLDLPQPENIYELSWNDPLEFNKLNNRHNLLVVSLRNPMDESGDILFDKLFRNYYSNDSLVAIYDLYNTNQLLFGILAADIQQLQENINRHSEFIKDNLDKNIRGSILYSAHDTGKNKKISEKIQNWFNFDMFIQKDFQLIKEDVEIPFLWIGRGYPYRWITFHEIELKEVYSPELTWNIIDSLLETTLGNVEITNDFRSNDLVKKGERGIPILRGNYFHSESESGGPFFSILMPMRKSKFLVISGFVNYPGHPKMSLVKQLEALILDGNFISKEKNE